MRRAALLLITAVGESATGLFLLLLPAVPLRLLLGLATAPETLLVARVAGTAIIAIGVASGMARDDGGSPALRAVLTGILVYDVAVAVVLAYAGIGLGLSGILLWPAVLVHVALAVWCVLVLRGVRSATG
jgi:phosphotransferase system  glucose/maltose/N-acetylglucosamine-specific IIC component